MDLLTERQKLIQRCIDLTTGKDQTKIQHNMELLKSALDKIENQTETIKLKNYSGQFAPVLMHL